MSDNERILDLDVGGCRDIRVKKSLLCSVPGSALEAMFSGRHKHTIVNGRIYLERDPHIFKLVISYLRAGSNVVFIENPK